MDKKEGTEEQEVSAESPDIRGRGRIPERDISMAQWAKDRPDGFNLECAVCVYYEILHSLKPEERLKFFKITSLFDQIVILQEFL